MRPPSFTFDVFDEAVDAFCLGIAQAAAGHIAAGLGQFLGNRRADAPGYAGDQGSTAVQVN